MAVVVDEALAVSREVLHVAVDAALAKRKQPPKLARAAVGFIKMQVVSHHRRKDMTAVGQGEIYVYVAEVFFDIRVVVVCTFFGDARPCSRDHDEAAGVKFGLEIDAVP